MFQSSARPVAGAVSSGASPSECTVISPQKSGPSAVRSPGFSAMNVAVAVARIAGAVAMPVSAERPVGMSSARIGARLAFAQLTSDAASGGNGRERPIPNSASTTSAGRRDGGSGTVVPPAATYAR